MKRFIIYVMLLVPVMAKSQRQTSAGLNFTVETTGDDAALAGLGAVVDIKISKHSGLETGLYLRSYKTHIGIYATTGGPWVVTVAERHLSFPILYKYHTKIVNLAAGPTFDFFTGWEQKGSKNAVVNSYSINPEFNVGVMGKISKAIILYPKLILEPEIRLNIIPTSERSYLGLGIACKYVL